jgi:hypothetical protein
VFVLINLFLSIAYEVAPGFLAVVLLINVYLSIAREIAPGFLVVFVLINLYLSITREVASRVFSCVRVDPYLPFYISGGCPKY